MRSRGIVALLVTGGALFACPGAFAATLSVDDDKEECPAAGYTSVQAAIDAASPGDTIAICPGTYTEGPGTAGTNALTITKSLTLRGAGADRVRISPPRTTAAGGQIADATLDIGDGVGDIVAVKGQPATPITVNISGVSVDGDGVYVEAGVVYIDAQGTISRVRVTDVVTTEQAGAPGFSLGAWRGEFPGYGIAHVTAATSSQPGARTLTVDNVRVDRYNQAGLVVAGGPGAVDNRAFVTSSEIVGRVLCQNFAADGNCSNPGLVTDGPLFGQDGVRVTGMARATVQSSILTQNLVNGTGAPVRQRWSANGQTMQDPGTTGNANLPLGAGMRLVAADAANSLITRSNIVDNAYGVYNVEADGTTANPVHVPAPMNWWGRRFTPMPAPSAPDANPGPAVSPAFNPPIPENPVNGSVDFAPYRDGAQGDPLTGQYANIQAPMPVDDLAPAASLSASDATVDRGQAITLTAAAEDDFGITSVTFFEGTTKLGTDELPPYTQAYTTPADAPCAARTLTAVARDSAGQTAGATTTVTVVNCVSAGFPPPGGSLPSSLNRIAQRGTTVTVTPTSQAGIAKVEFLLGSRSLCTVVAAPYSCSVVPRPGDVGLQSLRVVITDVRGQSIELSRQVEIRRFRSRGVRVAVEHQPLRRGRVQRTITARVRPPAGTTAGEVCRSGSLTFVVERRGRPFLNRQVALRDDCTASVRFTAKVSGRIHRVSARFAGNTVLLPAQKTRRFS